MAVSRVTNFEFPSAAEITIGDWLDVFADNLIEEDVLHDLLTGALSREEQIKTHGAGKHYWENIWTNGVTSAVEVWGIDLAFAAIGGSSPASGSAREVAKAVARSSATRNAAKSLLGFAPKGSKWRKMFEDDLDDALQALQSLDEVEAFFTALSVTKKFDNRLGRSLSNVETRRIRDFYGTAKDVMLPDGIAEVIGDAIDFIRD